MKLDKKIAKVNAKIQPSAKKFPPDLMDSLEKVFKHDDYSPTIRSIFPIGYIISSNNKY